MDTRNYESDCDDPLDMDALAATTLPTVASSAPSAPRSQLDPASPPLAPPPKMRSKEVDKTYGCSKCRYRGSKPCPGRDCRPRPAAARSQPPPRAPSPVPSLPDEDPPAAATELTTEATAASAGRAALSDEEHQRYRRGRRHPF